MDTDCPVPLPNDAAPAPLDGPPASSAQVVVPLAGVPETPAPAAGAGGVAAAVPSSDGYVTEGSPNKDTSSGDAPQPVDAPLTAVRSDLTGE